MKKKIVVTGIIGIIILLIAIIGSTNTTTNTITNNTTNITQINNTNVNNTTTYISAEKAKELASQYTGMEVGKGTLGTPTLTTFNGVKAWQFPVNDGYYNIYINAITGQRIPNNWLYSNFSKYFSLLPSGLFWVSNKSLYFIIYSVNSYSKRNKRKKKYKKKIRDINRNSLYLLFIRY